MQKLSCSFYRGGVLLFFVAAYIMLDFFKGDLLFRAQELSLFLWDGAFFSSFWGEPAFLLSYLSAFFTQFCYLAWLGALLLTGLAYLLYRLCRKAFVLSGPCALPWALIPSLFLLLWVTRMGYDLYTMRSVGLLFSPLLGFLWAVGMLCGYRSVPSLWGRALYLFLAAVACYPLFGAYVLFGLLLCAGSDYRKPALAVWGMLLLLFVPFVLHFFYSHTSLGMAYVAGLPLFDFYGDASAFYLLGCTALCLLCMVCISGRMTDGPMWLVASSLIALTVVLPLCSRRDINFSARLRMERAINANRWDDALSIFRKVQDPTRVLVMYKNLCLYKKGIILEKMFSYPDGSAAIEDAPRGNFSQMSAPMLYFHYGLLNFSQRWAMEQQVQYGENVENLRLMAKTALYQGEKPLVKKYLAILNKTLFYSYLYDRYSAYMEYPADMQRDGEYGMLAPLLSYDAKGIEDADFTERTLLQHYISLDVANESQLELSLAALLIAKESGPVFWKKYGMYSQFNHHLPCHLLEAVLLYSSLQGDTNRHLNYVRVAGGHNSPINQRFMQFMRLLDTVKERTAEVKTAFREQFGDTYWYYYYFVEIG